jgi:hypothetical protein
MAFQQSDLDKLDAAILSGVKKVTFADGRSTEFHSLDEMRRLRGDIKGELAAAESQVSPRHRFSIGRMVRR